MNHERTFLICSSVILVFAVINLSVGPVINKRVTNWSFDNCGKISDELDDLMHNNADMDTLRSKERELTRCRHRKPMYTLEEMSFITNLIIGFICFLFASFGLEKELKTRMGIVGMIFGVIGAIITLLYVIYNGIVCTNYYDNPYYKTDGDGAFAELDGNNYKCFYFGEPRDKFALYAKYIDLIKSQYNYNKELRDAFGLIYSEQNGCGGTPISCLENGYIEGPIPYNGGSGMRVCQKLYYFNDIKTYKNFDIGSRFIGSLILSILMVLFHCGLAFSGFLLFRSQ